MKIGHCLIVGNHGLIGGGGVKLSFGEDTSDSIFTRNYVHFSDVVYEKNYAIFGGGLSIAAHFSSSKSFPGEVLTFINCTWNGNFGLYSPAIDVSPFRYQQSRQLGGFLPRPLFVDCKVFDHYISTDYQPSGRNRFHVTQGVFVITRFTVYFQGSNTFKNNSLSAMYVTSGQVVFQSPSDVLFSDNEGVNGGAISVNGLSTIVVNDNSTFKFFNNHAVNFGGAIYYASDDQREYFEGRSCFLDYAGGESNVMKRNLNFSFVNNIAMRGYAIYSASLYSCQYAYVGSSQNFLKGEMLNHIGKFSFDRPIASSLGTGVRHAKYMGKSSLTVIPGKPLNLQLSMKDEFRSIVESGYDIRVKGNNSIYLSSYFTINNNTDVYGAPGQVAELVLSTPQQFYNIQYKIQVHLLPCPPGYFYEEDCKCCKCSADETTHSYIGITKCNTTTFRAYIQYGFWAGYFPVNASPDPDHLYTGLCPFSRYEYGASVLLPSTSDILSQHICVDNRHGILCGRCTDNHSTYYHSNNFACGDNRYCKIGIAFYLLSDILPLSIFLSVVITFGVSFSSGNLNGLVFFSQVFDTFSLEQNSPNSDTLVKSLHRGYQLIYGIFNLEFISIVPFCLWKGATIMDVLVFRYVTVLLALILVVLIVLVTNYSNTYIKIRALCRSRLKRWTGTFKSPRSSMIHGISTLLIISYGQCTKATFSILTTVYVRSTPATTPIRLTYYGGLPYLEGEHLLYAIPAMIVCLLIVILPPFCLLLYPSLLHLLALCGLSEHKGISRLLKCSGINHLMPMFDSFQGCYKDKMRFFSGLYFLYRVAILFAYTYSEVALNFYIAAQFLVLIFFGIHSIAQPYKLKKHNMIDSVIFLNLAIINGITLTLKMTKLGNVHTIRNITKPMALGQIAFAYFPIVALGLFGLKRLMAKLISKNSNNNSNTRHEESNCRSTVISEITHTSIELTESLL